MVNVAVAGGTGGVGRTIVEVLQSSKHEAFVLSRKPSKGVIPVDYGNIDKLSSILEQHNIHTVISAFAVKGDSLTNAQMNLIKAAIKSSQTKRFIPSAFAIPYPHEALQHLPQLEDYFNAIEMLKASDLEWTVFLNGIFLDYFIPPSMSSYLKPNVFVIDMAHKVAAIPGDGNAPVTFTYTIDLARFVVAALDLEHWPEESRIVGDEMSWNDFVALAEKTLECKFEIHYDSVDKLRQFEITELPGHQALYSHFPKKAFQWFMSIFELFTTDGGSCIAKEGCLNEQFPEIHPLTVEDALRKWK